jgi:mannose-6-phosphate isomerase-like protein (cupin superfamily)
MVQPAVARLDGVEEVVDAGSPFRAVRLHFDITSFGFNVWTGRDAGDRIINEHDEQDVGDEELFVVLHGRAVFELDGDRVDAPAGSLVHCPSGTRRTAFAEEADTTILALDGTPGKAYEPRGWELWTQLAPLYDAGEYAEVADRLRAVVEEHQRYALLFFNLACCESLTGQTASALDHLRRAIVLKDEFRGLAMDDPDLASLRGDPAFEELLSRTAPPV